MNASATAAHSICGTSATLSRTAAIVSSSGGCIEKNHTQTDKKMCQLSRDHLLLIELLCRAGFEFTQCCVHSSSLRIHLGIYTLSIQTARAQTWGAKGGEGRNGHLG